ncbi:MAG: A/G-specific adenine glycosylase [Chloroflexota bacterium]
MTQTIFDSSDIVPILLEWWDAGHADWPWRNTRDPYAIWVAEVMLQQTQIATVLPYYERWLARFSTVEELAAADLAEVLKLWEGLGYYGRARHLHAAAQTIVRDYDGRLPNTVEELLKLKGIGRYTAGAIASMAFDRPAAVLDGNVIRVLTRLLDLADDVTLPGVKRELWELAERLLPAARPGDYNQALMELGQSVCRPAAPQCHLCPLAGLCLARERGTQLERPVRPPRARTPHYDVAAGVIRGSDGRLLIARRPLNGLLGGLWEFPGGKQRPGESLPETLRREIREELDVEIEVERPLTVIQHAYTHFRISLHAFHARYLSGQPRCLGVADYAWVYPADLDGYAFAATDRQIINKLMNNLEQT